MSVLPWALGATVSTDGPGGSGPVADFDRTLMIVGEMTPMGPSEIQLLVEDMRDVTP